jgi:thioredoxin 1
MKPYEAPGPSREDIDAQPGPLLLEFGTNWCGHCQSATPLVAEALLEFSTIPHIRVEDGPGRRLGRSFAVKLWPTLICLKDGIEVVRVVRPDSANQVRDALRQITS